MIKSFTIVLLAFVIILSGCKNDVSEEIKEYKIKSTEAPIIFSQIVDSIEFLPLENTSESLFSNISKILVINNKIFVIDKLRTKSISVFNDHGKFLYKIHKIGKGPNEYASISDVTIDPVNQLLIIYDNGSGKLLRFDFEGKMVDEINVSLIINEISCDNSGRILIYCPYLEAFYQNKSYNPGLYLYNPGTKKLKSILDDGEVGGVIGLSPGLIGYGNKTKLCSQYSDTIYGINDLGIYKSHYFDFGKNKIPKSFYNLSMSDVNISKLYDSEYITGKHKYFESDSLIYFFFTKGRISYQCLINKPTGTVLTGKYFQNDIIPFNFSFPLWIENNILYCFIQAGNFILGVNALKKDIHYSSNSEAYLNKTMDLLNNINENSNPILVKIKLHSF